MEFDRQTQAWGAAFRDINLGLAPAPQAPTKKELITMGPFEALQRFPVFVSRTMGPHIMEKSMLLAEDQDAQTTPANYFATDMFSVHKSAFTDRGDARFIQTGHAPRLTSSDVTKIGQYLAAQIQASGKDVSYIILSVSSQCNLYVCRGEYPRQNML